MNDFEKMLEELRAIEQIKLSKKEKKIIGFLKEDGHLGFYDLLEYLDIKPSRLDKHLLKLVEYGLVNINEDMDDISLTELAEAYLSTTKADRKTDKKFLKTIESLNEEELEELEACFDEALNKEAEEVEEAK